MAPATAHPSGIRSLDELPLANRRVLVRADFDVPLTNDGDVADDRKLRAALPTLSKALAEGARVVVATHWGGPDDAPRSLLPVAERLAELLGREVFLPDECAGDAARKVVSELREGQLCLLENLRFAPEEQQADEAFARKLASLCDVYVGEALAWAHSNQTSLVALPRLVKDRGMGYGLQAALDALTRLSVTVQKPFVGMLGGASLLDKLDVFELMLRRCDAICVGGVPANTLLAAREQDVKGSLFDREQLPLARALLTRARDRKVELLLPVDVVVAETPDADQGRAVGVGAVPDGAAIVDLGPQTLEAFRARARGAQTLLLHGALGKLEQPAFASGTQSLLEALAGSPGFGVVAGDGVAALARRAGAELESRIGFVSEGGMAPLAIIEGKKLPGVEALRE